jgi:hypothetical protein
MLSLEALVSDSTTNKLILLCYVISAMELDKEEEIMDQLVIWDLQAKNINDQALSWYASLALIKTDRLEEARSMLHSLTLESGPYQSDAENLLKLLLK